MYSLTQDGTYSTAIPEGTAAQEYTVWYKVLGDTRYTGTDPASVTVTIAPKSIDGAVITLGEALTANGSTQTQRVERVTLDGQVLTAADYTVENADAKNPGSYTLTVRGIGNYTGSVQAAFAVTPASTSTPNPTATPTAAPTAAPTATPNNTGSAGAADSSPAPMATPAPQRTATPTPAATARPAALPTTGDSMPVTALVVLLGIGAAGLAAVAVLRRKRK